MNGSWTILVKKRDESYEKFSVSKLAGCFWRAMQETTGRYSDARSLAEVIEIHLTRKRIERISSRALFEMALKVLGKVAMDDTAECLELHRICRTTQREGLLVDHGNGQLTGWDKSWIADYAHRAWGVSSTTARIIAGIVEDDLLSRALSEVRRETVLAHMNRCVEQYGLADAVPVTPSNA